MENEIQPNNQPVQPITQTFASSLNNWSIIILCILLGSILVTGSVFIGIQIGKRQFTQQIIQSQVAPTSIPSKPSQASPTLVSTVKPTTTIEPITIPSNWKQFTAIDPEFKIKTTMSMPPGFSFSFTGSEFTIQNDSDATELWDYSTSIFSGKDGLKNYYDGTSRRAWYQRKLSGEFTIPEETQKKRGDILDVIEHNIGTQSYLEVLVKSLSGNQEKHYLFVENGILHVIKPASDKANSSEALIPKYIGTIFVSLTSFPIK